MLTIECYWDFYVKRNRSLKDTAQIHLIKPLSGVTNRWTFSVPTNQVLIKAHFAWIAWLVRIDNNSPNALHEEKIYVKIASEQPPHWPIVWPKYLKVDSTWKKFPMLTFLMRYCAPTTTSYFMEFWNFCKMLVEKWELEDPLWCHFPKYFKAVWK